jgi:hypothetical protein
MDDRHFDRISRIVAATVDRRAGLRALGALAAALSVGLPAAVDILPEGARARKNKKHKKRCIATGNPCSSASTSGNKRHGKKNTHSCNRCCQKHSAVVGGVTQCSCQDTYLPCATASECCSGVCTDGVCESASAPICAAGSDYCRNVNPICGADSTCSCFPRQDGRGSVCTSMVVGEYTPPPGACGCTSNEACNALSPGAVCVLITDFTTMSFACGFVLGLICGGATSFCAVPCASGA